MKLNVECNHLTFDKTAMSLDEIAVIALLQSINNQGVVDAKEAFGEPNLLPAITTLKQLAVKKIITLKETNEADSLVINVINKQVKKVKYTNLSKNKMLQVVFQLDEKKLKTIVDNSVDKASFRHNLVKICHANYELHSLPHFEINSQEDMIEYLESLTPFEVMVAQGHVLKRNDFEQIFDIINDYSFEIPLINFAIDYAISSSRFHGLRYEFVRILLDSWAKHNLTRPEEAIKLIQLQKEQKARGNSKFVEPTYEQPKIDEPVAAPKVEGQTVDINQLIMGDDSFE